MSQEEVFRLQCLIRWKVDKKTPKEVMLWVNSLRHNKDEIEHSLLEAVCKKRPEDIKAWISGLAHDDHRVMQQKLREFWKDNHGSKPAERSEKSSEKRSEKGSEGVGKAKCSDPRIGRAALVKARDDLAKSTRGS